MTLQDTSRMLHSGSTPHMSAQHHTQGDNTILKLGYKGGET